MNRIRMNVFCVMLLTLTIGLVQSHAGSGSKQGTAGGDQLLIPVGGIGTALSGAVSSSVRGVEAIYWNPAGVAAMSNSAEALFSHMSYLAAMSVQYAAVAASLGEFGHLGFSIKSIDFGDIPVTTVDLPDGTGETYSPTFITLGLTYSRRMTDRILFGANVKLVSEEIMRENANALAFDFGLQYQPALQGFRFGVALKNIGTNLRYDGPDLEQTIQLPGTEPGTQLRPVRLPSAPMDLPSTLEFGVSYEASAGEANTLMLTSTFVNNNYAYDDLKVGGQWAYDNMLFLRAGYMYSFDQPSAEKLYSYTLGAGFNFKVAESMSVAVDYAFRPVQYGALGDNHIFSFKIGL